MYPHGQGARVLIVRDVAADAVSDRLVDAALPWVHEAGNPYYDWLFGGPERARVALAAWLARPSSEVWLGRARVAEDQGRLAGGHLTLTPEELAHARSADTVALARVVARSERAALLERVRAVEGLFHPVEPDALYLSRLGVLPWARGRGVGRRLLEDVLERARSGGFPRCRLDVASANEAAIRLYARAGFEPVAATACAVPGLAYTAMAVALADPRPALTPAGPGAAS